MTDPLANIERLLPVLDMAYRAEQLKMARIVARINELKAQMAALDAAARPDPMSAAVLAGADLRWEAWVQDRKTLINREIALAMRDREVVRGRMIAALSKREAAKRVRNGARLDAAQIAHRRSDW